MKDKDFNNISIVVVAIVVAAGSIVVTLCVFGLVHLISCKSTITNL